MTTRQGTGTLNLELLSAHRAFVRGVARSIVAGDAEVDDVVQDTWVSALSAGPTDGRSPRGWLATVVRRRAIDRLRRAGRRTHHERRALPAARPLGPDEIAQIEEVRRRVVRRVLALGEPYRAAVLMRYYHGLGPREAAEALGVPLQTFKTRLKRALVRLREELERDGTTRDRGARAALLGLAGIGATTGSWTLALTAALVLVLLGSGLWLLWPGPGSRRGAAARPDALTGSVERGGADAGVGTAPSLSGMASQAEGPARAAVAVAPAGCWLVGTLHSPVGFGGEPPTVTVAPSTGGETGSPVTASANADGTVRIDLAPVLRSLKPGALLREIRVTLDHPDHLRKKVAVSIPRGLRDVFYDAQGYAEVAIDEELQPAPFKIVGAARLPGGHDPSTARLALYPADEDGRPATQGPLDHAELDASGLYVLRAPSKGRYLLTLFVLRGLAPALRPETVLVEARAHRTQVAELRPDAGLEITGQVTSPAIRAPARLSVSAQIQHGASPYAGWGGVEWQGERFEYAERTVTVDRDGRFRVAGLGPFPYRLQVDQALWQDGDEIPTLFVGDRKYAPTKATAPARDVALSFPWEVWLLDMHYENGDVQSRWVGVPWYARNVFVSYWADPRGRVAAFVRPGSYHSAEHAFLSPIESQVISAVVTPNAWTRLTFPDRPKGASLDIHLTPQLDRQTRYYEISFSRLQPGGRRVWMRGRDQLARQGDLLHLEGLTPGAWHFELLPRAGSVVDFTSHLLPVEGEVELKAGKPNTLDVQLVVGGCLVIEPLTRYLPSLGFPEVRKDLSDVHKVSWRVVDGLGKEQDLRVTRLESKAEEFGSPSRTKELHYGFGREGEDLYFWPPLAPGTYTLELWTGKRSEESLHRVRFEIESGRTTRLAHAP